MSYQNVLIKRVVTNFMLYKITFKNYIRNAREFFRDYVSGLVLGRLG